MKKYQRREAFCIICNKIRPVKKRVEDKCICTKCYRPPKQKCSVCSKLDKVFKYINSRPVCPKCIRERCAICDKVKQVAIRINENSICPKCNKSKCVVCGEINTIKKRTEGGYICIRCYQNPKEKCVSCGKKDFVKTRIDGEPLCWKCNSDFCYICKREKPIYIRSGSGNPICRSCSIRIKRQKDNSFRIKEALRSALHRAFNNYLTVGKELLSTEYGINYKAIIEHLGECPDKEKYHIDHIYPLAAFDFNDPFEIWAAFHPENHRWLDQKENLIKNAKYDHNKFIEYLNVKKVEYMEDNNYHVFT